MKNKKTTLVQVRQNTFSWKTDIPFWLLVLLAVITVPRVVAHDLHWLALDSPLYKVLSIAPWVLFLALALLRKNKRPFYDFMVLGVLFGIALAVTHQITWNASWGDDPPKIGGNLKDVFSPLVESIILRTAAFISSIVTGLMVGVIFGAVATVVRWVRQWFTR